VICVACYVFTMEKILRLLNKEFVGLHRAAYLLGFFAFLSQILALVRDRMLAHYFGAGSTLDIYYAAFRVPDFIYVSIASFVSITVLIPFLAKKINNNKTSNDDARDFLNNVFSVFFMAIVFVAVLAYIFAPSLAKLMAPGFTPDEHTVYISLMRILLLSPVFLGISSLFGSVTQTYRKFIVYASAPVLYNIGIISGIVFLYPLYGIYGVAYGVIIGALLHLLIQLPVIVKHKFIPRFMFRLNFSQISEVLLLSLPRTVALSANHITLIVLFALASLMDSGSIAVFNFSFNLQSVPLSIIGVSYSVAAFPTLARFFSQGNTIEFKNHIGSAVRHIIFWSIPAMVLFVVLRAQIVRVILGSGAFDWADTRLTAAALAVFALSVCANGLMLLFVRGYYAAGKTKTPLLINISSSVAIVLLGFLFIRIFKSFPEFQYFLESLLRVEGIPGRMIIVLPLAYTIGVILNGALLWHFFKRDIADFSHIVGNVLIQTISASVIMGFVAYHFLNVFDGILDVNTFWGIFMQGFLSGIIGIFAGIVVLLVLKNREIREIGANIHNRVWKKKGEVIAADQEEL